MVTFVAENGNIGQDNHKAKNAVKNYEGPAPVPQKIKEKNHKGHKDGPVAESRSHKKKNRQQNLWKAVKGGIYYAKH